MPQGSLQNRTYAAGRGDRQQQGGRF